MKINIKKVFNKTSKISSLAGASCIIYKDGKIIETMNYGYSSREKKRKMTNDTVFRIASVSKIIVAICVMHLYEEGKLSLDEDISTYLGFNVVNPNFNNVPITIRMLLTQTSSITDGLEEGSNNSEINTGYNLVNGTNLEVSLKDLLTNTSKYYTDDTFSKHKPGTCFQYSNFGCGILACIIEKITGEYFTEYVKNLIFKPLDIDASFVASDIKSSDIISTYKNSKGYVLYRTKESFIDAVYNKFPLGENYRGPAGGLFISTNSLMKIMISLMQKNASFIKEETIDEMMEMNYIGSHIPFDSYCAKGLQLEILDYFDNRRLYGHFGDAYCVKSFFLFNKEQDLGMIYMTNGGDYKYQESGICDIHEVMIKNILDKYWQKIPYVLTFKTDSKIGYLNKRKVTLDYHMIEGNPHFSYMSLFDNLGLNTYSDYEKLKPLLVDKGLDDAISIIEEFYEIQLIKNDDSYMICYKR